MEDKLDTGGDVQEATLLDYMAAKLMPAIFTAFQASDGRPPVGDTYQHCAREAYMAASALLAEKRRLESLAQEGPKR